MHLLRRRATDGSNLLFTMSTTESLDFETQRSFFCVLEAAFMNMESKQCQATYTVIMISRCIADLHACDNHAAHAGTINSSLDTPVDTSV